MSEHTKQESKGGHRSETPCEFDHLNEDQKNHVMKEFCKKFLKTDDTKQGSEGDLRPEAHPFKFEDLNKNQKDAFEKIVKKLKSALDAIKEERYYNELDNPAVPAIYQCNRNPIVFLSGERGSGKTTLLLTLMDEYRKLLTKNQSNFESPLKEDFNELHERLVWLEPLDMDPLPGPANLLAAILARIEEAIERFYKRGSSGTSRPNIGNLVEPYPDYQKSLGELNSLQRDVALTWDGNVKERAAEIDPDSFAVEVIRAEKSRLRLNYRFRKALNKLAETVFDRIGPIHNPLFILPIDDFDLNPLRCIELNRLIRMISLPRLFTIILGNIKIVRNVFYLKIRNELSTAGCLDNVVPPTISLDPYSIHYRRPFSTIPTETASNAMRKLIPPTHIVVLKTLKVEDGLDFKPSEGKPTIRDLLKKIPVQINIAEEISGLHQYVAGQAINTLADLFDASNIIVDKNNEQKQTPKKIYSARAFFKLPPRHLMDLWLFLNQPPSIDGNPSWRGIEFARRIFRETVREDQFLTPDMIEDMINAADYDFEGNQQFNTDMFVAENYTGPEAEFLLEGRSFVAHQAKDWHIKINIRVGGTSMATKLSERTEAAVVFLHDILALRRPRGIVGDSLIQKLSRSGAGKNIDTKYGLPPKDTGDDLEKKHSEFRWAYSKWDFGARGIVEIPWHIPPWQSFWECDFLRRSWNDIWMRLRLEIEPKIRNIMNDYTITSYLAYSWIKMGTIILSGEKTLRMELPEPKGFKIRQGIEEIKTNFNAALRSPPDEYFESLERVFPCVDKWLELVGHLSDLAIRLTTSTDIFPLKREIIQGWLARVACMLAPESGIPSSAAILFFSNKGDELLKFWMKPDVARLIRRIRARSAAEFYKKRAFDSLKDLFAPKKVSELREKTNDLDKLLKKMTVDENFRIEDLVFNWFGNKTIRRNAINIIGYETLCPAIKDIKRLSDDNSDDDNPIWGSKSYRDELYEELRGKTSS